MSSVIERSRLVVVAPDRLRSPRHALLVAPAGACARGGCSGSRESVDTTRERQGEEPANSSGHDGSIPGGRLSASHAYQFSTTVAIEPVRGFQDVARVHEVVDVGIDSRFWAPSSAAITALRAVREHRRITHQRRARSSEVYRA